MKCQAASAEASNIGQSMYAWACDLFPMARSITGPGLRESLGYIQKLIPAMNIVSVPSGFRAFDWVVPDEWTIRDAYIADESGTRLVDYRKHNLHVVGYSEAI